MKEKINNIPEVKHYFYKFIIYAILMLIVILAFVFFVLLEENPQAITWEIFIYIGVILLPLFMYNSYKMIYYLKLKPTHIQEIKLDTLESKWTTYMAFKLEMNFFGRLEEVDTLRIFKPRPIGYNRVDDYLNKRVLVGYDETKKKAIILKILN